MAFYYLCVVARIGGYVLGLPPTLYALPAMLAAAAAVRVADGLKESGCAERPVALLRLAGYAISALAFALALARPSSRLPLLSGNTLATALVGLALYGRALWKERKPAYLYAAFAALFLAYFGTHEFFKDLFSAFEGTIGDALGYGKKLPLAFRALNGLVFNVLLAAMSLVFRRRWEDDRLARHCGYIGLPVSIAACVLSTPRPAGGGARRWADTRSPSASPPGCSRPPRWGISRAWPSRGRRSRDRPTWATWRRARSLALATVGLVLWMACRVLAIEKIPPAYRVPVVHSARAISALALLFAAWAALPGSPRRGRPPGRSGAGMPVCADRSGDAAGHRGLCRRPCAAVAAILTIRLATARFGLPIGPVWLAAWSSGLSLIDLAASPGSGASSRPAKDAPGGRAVRALSRPAPPPRADPGRPGDVARHLRTSPTMSRPSRPPTWPGSH